MFYLKVKEKIMTREDVEKKITQITYYNVEDIKLCWNTYYVCLNQICNALEITVNLNQGMVLNKIGQYLEHEMIIEVKDAHNKYLKTIMNCSYQVNISPKDIINVICDYVIRNKINLDERLGNKTT